jgi:hypothetical protein
LKVTSETGVRESVTTISKSEGTWGTIYCPISIHIRKLGDPRWLIKDPVERLGFVWALRFVLVVFAARAVIGGVALGALRSVLTVRAIIAGVALGA